MATILYYYDSQGKPNYDKIYSNFKAKKDELIGQILSRRKADKFCQIINKTKLNISDIAKSASTQLQNLTMIDGNDQEISYVQLMKDITDAAESKLANPPASVQAMIGIRSGLFPNGVFTVNNPTSVLEDISNWVGFSQLDFSNKLGKIGEDFSSFAGETLAYNILQQLLGPQSSINIWPKDLKVNYTNTGKQRVLSTTGNTTPRLTDNILTISYTDTKTSEKIMLKFNISDKYGKNILSNNAQNKTSRIKMRSSTINVVMREIGLDKYDILNTLSFHRETQKMPKSLRYKGYTMKPRPKSFIKFLNTSFSTITSGIIRERGDKTKDSVMEQCFSLIKKLLGFGLINQIIVEKRFNLSHHLINDRVSFLVKGDKIVPFDDIIAKATDKIANTSASLTQISGIREDELADIAQKNALKSNKGDARSAIENYLLTRSITLQLSI